MSQSNHRTLSRLLKRYQIPLDVYPTYAELEAVHQKFKSAKAFVDKLDQALFTKDLGLPDATKRELLREFEAFYYLKYKWDMLFLNDRWSLVQIPGTVEAYRDEITRIKRVSAYVLQLLYNEWIGFRPPPEL